MVSTADRPPKDLDAATRGAWCLRRTDPERARAMSTSGYRAALTAGDQRGAAACLFTLAFCEVDAAEFEGALEKLGEAAQLFAAVGDTASQARVAGFVALAECRRGRPDAALMQVNAALAAARACGATGAEVQALLAAGEIHSYQGDLERSLERLQQARSLAADPHDASETLLLLSRTQRLLGNYPEALRCGNEALGRKRAAGDRLGEVYALNALGLAHHDPHEGAAALAYYAEGLSLSERLGNRRSTLVLLGNLGELYADMGDLPKALEYVRRSLALSEAVGSRHTEGVSLEGLGGLYARMGDAANALCYYRRALALRLELGDRHGEASTLHALGNLCFVTAQPREAEGYFRESLALARAVGHPYLEAEILASLGHLHAKEGRDIEARCAYEVALELAARMKLLALTRDLHRVLYELHRRAADYEGALRHHEALFAAESRLSGEAAGRRTARLLIQFELERAQQEAASSRQRSAELAQANATLEATNRLNANLLGKLREQTRQLRRLAEEDGLTGLYNRRYAERRLKREFRRASRHAQPLSLALLDIDNFKSINDRFSHAAGDRVLKTVADLIRGSLRPADVAARYGGEEFVVAWSSTPDDAGAACEALCRAVAAYPWGRLHPELRVTLMT